MMKNESQILSIEEEARIFARNHDADSRGEVMERACYAMSYRIPGTAFITHPICGVVAAISPSFHLIAASRPENAPSEYLKTTFSDCMIKDGKLQRTNLASCEIKLQETEIAYQQRTADIKQGAIDWAPASVTACLLAAAFMGINHLNHHKKKKEACRTYDVAQYALKFYEP